MFSASPFARCKRQSLALVLLTVGSLVACYKEPRVDESKPRACQGESKTCPTGYVCGPDGRFCCASTDGKTCSAGTDAGLDSSTPGPNIDAPVSGADGPAENADTATGDDGASITGGAGATAGASGTGGAATGGTTASGGAGASGGTSASGGGAPTGGLAIGGATGGTAAAGTVATGGTASAGTGGGGSAGSGGQITCTGATKLCNGSCIPNTSCCGGCSGNTPVCSNGTCAGRPLGDACASGAECASTYCADGVCCNVACDGQCEACSVSGSKGTCVPSTTPRTPCAGTGPCAGLCDGSTKNRRMCVYPDDKTSCGPSASCSAGKLTSAAVCNGAGACNASTTSTCAYGCRTDGTTGCATSCPTGQGLCSGSCVDILSSPAHCGGSCQTCSGTTPRCYSGSCVQCLTGADCVGYADGATCGLNHSCQCRVPNAGNLLVNPGFTSDLAGWVFGGEDGKTIHSSSDAEYCPTSGSVQLSTAEDRGGGLYQCVQVAANTTYNFGYRYLQQEAESLDCVLLYYEGPTCSGDWFAPYTFLKSSEGSSAWQYADVSSTSPENAGSASVSCTTFGSGEKTGWIDNVYLNATARY